MQETAGPKLQIALATRSVKLLPIKLLALWRSLTSVHPHSSNSFGPLDFDGSPYPPGFGKTAIGRIHLSFLCLIRGNDIPRTSFCQKTLQIAPSDSQTTTSPQSIAHHTPKNGQAHRQPLKPPGSNIRVCIDFVCKIFIFQKILKYVAYWFEVLKSISSVGQNQKVAGQRWSSSL